MRRSPPTLFFPQWNLQRRWAKFLWPGGNTARRKITTEITSHIRIIRKTADVPQPCAKLIDMTRLTCLDTTSDGDDDDDDDDAADDDDDDDL